MSVEEFFSTRFEDWYDNPDWVAFLFTLLVFIFAFSGLQKFVFKDNKGVNLVIAVCISLMFLISFRDLTGWIATFNLITIITVVGVLVALAFPFYKFIKKQF